MVHADRESLETLGAELVARGFEAHLVTSQGRQPWLAVRNPRAAVMSEDVMMQGGWFWWPWAGYAIGIVTTWDRTRFLGQRRRPGPGPYTVLTDDLGELRAELSHGHGHPPAE